MTPAARPRRGVLLVPGWSDRARALDPLRRFLIRSGWRADHVVPVSFRDRFGSNAAHAEEIAAAAAALRAAAAGDAVDIVAHSMGGLAARLYLLTSKDATHVRRAVFLGTPHRGTWLAWLAWGAGAPEMRPGSPFLQRLAAARLPAHVEAHTIRGRLDLRIVPGIHAQLEDVPDTLVPWITHNGLLRSPRVHRLVRDALLRP